MKKRLPSFLGIFALIHTFILLSPGSSGAQSIRFGNGRMHWEAGLNIGPSVFMGDMGGNQGKGTHFLKDLNLEFTKVMKGAFVTMYPDTWIGFRLAAQIGQLEANDNIINTKGEDELYRRQRNLDFKSSLAEVYIATEFYPTLLLNRYEDYEPRLQPYSVIGLGFFHFNPKGSLMEADGSKSWHALQPLRTEGQGMKEYPGRTPYKLTQVNVPVGLGMRYIVSERVNMSFEVLYRKTFTDYIDDVSTDYIDPNLFDVYLPPADAAIARRIHDKLYSNVVTPGILRTMPGVQRGNPKQNDAYFSMFLKFGVRLGDIFESQEARSAVRQVKCSKPSF